MRDAFATDAAAYLLHSPPGEGSRFRAASGEVGECMGVNPSKGKSICKTAESACAVRNACKGKGLVPMTEETCLAISPLYQPFLFIARTKD